MPVQRLKLGDRDERRRYEMCERLRTLNDEQLIKTAFTDEATFCLGNKTLRYSQPEVRTRA